MSDIMLAADFFKPLCTSASRCNDRIVRSDLHFNAVVVGDIDSLALFAVEDDIRALIAEENLNAVCNEIFFDCKVDVLCLFRSHMTNRAVNKLKTGLNCTGTNLSDFLCISDTFNLSICAEFKIYTVGIVDSFLNQIFTDEIRKVTADLIAQRQLAVRECACTGETGCNVAIRLAIHTFLSLCLGAVSVFDRLTFFDNDDLFLSALAKHFNSCEYTGRACSDDYNVCFHNPDTSEKNKKPNIYRNAIDVRRTGFSLPYQSYCNLL